MPTKTYNRIFEEHLCELITQGNHEAFVRLKKRYDRHAVFLVRKLLETYPCSGLTLREVLSVHDNHFPYVIKKYNPELCSFYYYWEKSVTRYITDFIMENSYRCNAKTFVGAFSYDDEYEDGNEYSSVLAENDEETKRKRIVKEVETLIERYPMFFELEELSVIKLALNGYSFLEIEKSGMMSRSKVFLTFNSAYKKLEKLMKNFYHKC